MGKFLVGLIGTVFTVLITLYVQDWYASQKATTKFDIGYRIYDSSIPIRKDVLRSALEHSESYSPTLNVSYVDIQNVGSEPITDQLVTIKRVLGGEGKPVLAIGTIAYPGNSEKGVSLRRNDSDGVEIRYELLNPGERHRIWILHNTFQTFDVEARKPGLHISSLDSEFGGSLGSDSFWDDVIPHCVIALVTLAIGGLMGASIMHDAIKRRGFDPDEILKLPIDKGER